MIIDKKSKDETHKAFGLIDAKCQINSENYADAFWNGDDLELKVNYFSAKRVFPFLLADAFMGHFNRFPTVEERKNIMIEFEKDFLNAIHHELQRLETNKKSK